jgi:hypothetical protein
MQIFLKGHASFMQNLINISKLEIQIQTSVIALVYQLKLPECELWLNSSSRTQVVIENLLGRRLMRAVKSSKEERYSKHQINPKQASEDGGEVTGDVVFSSLFTTQLLVFVCVCVCVCVSVCVCLWAFRAHELVF